jgi:hypothetical protein
VAPGASPEKLKSDLVPLRILGVGGHQQRTSDDRAGSRATNTSRQWRCNAGRNILRLLTGVLTDTDDKVGEHIKRLIAICPDGEKLATLVKAAAGAVDSYTDTAIRIGS